MKQPFIIQKPCHTIKFRLHKGNTIYEDAFSITDRWVRSLLKGIYLCVAERFAVPISPNVTNTFSNLQRTSCNWTQTSFCPCLKPKFNRLKYFLSNTPAKYSKMALFLVS